MWTAMLLLAPESGTRGPPISSLIKYFPPESVSWCREHYKSRKGHLLIGKWKQTRWIGSTGWAQQIKINKEGDVNSSSSSPHLKSLPVICCLHIWVMLLRYWECVSVCLHKVCSSRFPVIPPTSPQPRLGLLWSGLPSTDIHEWYLLDAGTLVRM